MTLLRKHSDKRVFTLADTLRFVMFPSLRLQWNRNAFLHVSDRFPSQESRICKIFTNKMSKLVCLQKY